MDYQSLAKYLADPSYYEGDFDIANENNLYDYSIIILWKTFVLFSYEKIKQVREIIGDEEFNDGYWNKGSLTCKENSTTCKTSLENFEVENVYAYSAVQDDDVIDLLSRIFGLEKNYSQLLKNIKNDRNTASHVASEILQSQETTVAKTLHDLARVTEHIDQVYKTKFLTRKDPKGIVSAVTSESDLNYLVSSKILDAIRASGSFDQTEELYKSIAKKRAMLSCASIKGILEAIQEGRVIGGKNQALDLGYSFQFLSDLLKESYGRTCELDFWKTFYLALSNGNQMRFYDIRKSLQNHGVEFDLMEIDYIHPDDIPF